MEDFPWSLAKACAPLPPSHEAGPWGSLALPVLNVVSLPVASFIWVSSVTCQLLPWGFQADNVQPLTQGISRWDCGVGSCL